MMPSPNLNLTSRERHHVENASTATLKFSLGEALELCQDDFAEAIRQELKARANRKGEVMPSKTPTCKRQVMTVQRVDQSPMNAKRWCLTLSCGHEVWVTANRKPARMKAECERCLMVEAER
jgi:hypothetical protein